MYENAVWNVGFSQHETKPFKFSTKSYAPFGQKQTPPLLSALQWSDFGEIYVKQLVSEMRIQRYAAQPQKGDSPKRKNSKPHPKNR